MVQTRSEKQDQITRYQEGMASAENAFLVGFKGITVPQVTELRDKIRETGGNYEVVKNTLALRAVEGKGLEQLKEHFVGPTAIAYADGDPVALAKALTDFRKASPVIEFKAGLLAGQPVAASDLEDIANLPSRDELMAKLLFLMQSPVTRFVRTLAALPRGFVIALDQIAQKKEA